VLRGGVDDESVHLHVIPHVVVPAGDLECPHIPGIVPRSTPYTYTVQGTCTGCVNCSTTVLRTTYLVLVRVIETVDSRHIFAAAEISYFYKIICEVEYLGLCTVLEYMT
jgi:hypothetical protein